MWPMLPDDLQSLESTPHIAHRGRHAHGGVFSTSSSPHPAVGPHHVAAFNDKGAYGYTPKGGTGATVRTFVQIAAEMAAGSL